MHDGNNVERRLSFSQRSGYEDLPEPMRLEQISDELRREIWNLTRRWLDDLPRTSPVELLALSSSENFVKEGRIFVEEVLGEHLALPEDDILTDTAQTKAVFKKLILDHEPFNRLLDLLEAMINHPVPVSIQKAAEIRNLFNKHAAPYRLDDISPFRFIPRSTEEQGEVTAESVVRLRSAGMDGASTHLRQATVHLRHKRYAESITASVHAVESVARLLASDAGKALSPALNSLERSGLLKHKALKNGMLNRYGYASDEQGLRHALVDQSEADVGEDEALFMYGACACFAAYLADKHRKP